MFPPILNWRHTSDSNRFADGHYSTPIPDGGWATGQRPGLAGDSRGSCSPRSATRHTGRAAGQLRTRSEPTAGGKSFPRRYGRKRVSWNVLPHPLYPAWTLRKRTGSRSKCCDRKVVKQMRHRCRIRTSRGPIRSGWRPVLTPNPVPSAMRVRVG